MIDIDTIERYVEQTLEFRGLVNGGNEQQVRLLLRHYYIAASLWNLFSFDDKMSAIKWNKKFKDVFLQKNLLKERKRTKRKELSPSALPLVEKEIKEKEQKNKQTIEGASPSGLEERKAAFHAECHQFDEQYGRQMVDDFYVYWSEENKNDQKMLWEYQRTWSTAKRLFKWSKSAATTERKSASMRLERTKNKSAAPVSSKEQQAQTARRAEANSRLEEQIAQAKAEAVPYEEYRRRLSEKFKTEK